MDGQMDRDRQWAEWRVASPPLSFWRGQALIIWHQPCQHNLTGDQAAQ